MHIRIIDLDGGIIQQKKLLRLCQPDLYRVRKWGPRIRLGCRFGRFQRFERTLARLLGSAMDRETIVTLCGSGDFHHVSLALLRRQPHAFNLLVVDNHPDWMRGVPFLHCGTWLRHAANLPQVRRIFHVGGDVDFDNHYRWLAPWSLLTAGKIIVLPAIRTFSRGRWAGVANDPLKVLPGNGSKKIPPLGIRLREMLSPFLRDLGSWPLYITLDKDVMVPADAVVNWDSGHLSLGETRTALETFLTAASGNLAGMDIVGDWSPVRVDSIFGRFLSYLEHPALTVDGSAATDTNERTNLALLETIGEFANQTGQSRSLAAARRTALA
jgi:hypothetical protein